MNPHYLITGCALVGYILVECLALSGKRVPLALNLMGAASFGLIAASLVL